MIYRGIIEKIIDRYSAQVRLPLIHRTADSKEYTATHDLPIARVCVSGKHHPNLQVGDIVLVGIENNDSSRLIILGYLYSDMEINATPSASFTGLTVKGDAVLPTATSIGNISAENILQLAGIESNIQNQLNILANRISQIEEALKTS